MTTKRINFDRDLSRCALDHAPKHDMNAREAFNKIRARMARNEVPEDQIESLAPRLAMLRIMDADAGAKR